VKELGYDYDSIPPNQTFVDYLSTAGELDAITKQEIRNQLRDMFIKNPLIDNNFAIACSLLTGGMLGHPMLEDSNKQLLISWLSGSKDVKLSALRNLGLSPAKITKYNARHMLRSLLEVLKTAGVPGIIVMIDNLESLSCASSLDAIRYTKIRRDDVYESLRELIDEGDTLKNIMFFFAFDRILLDDERAGLKSYVALWMRMQNEIMSSRFNKCTDFYDMDKFIESAFDNRMLVEMSERLALVINRTDDKASPICAKSAASLLSDAKHTAVSIPRQVGSATLNRVEAASVEAQA
jgi:anti-anti-sigma regulatory factor